MQPFLVPPSHFLPVRPTTCSLCPELSEVDGSSQDMQVVTGAATFGLRACELWLGRREFYVLPLPLFKFGVWSLVHSAMMA